MTPPTLTIKTFVDRSFGENAYVVSTAATDSAGAGLVGWAIDPSFSPQVDAIIEYVRAQNITLERIVLTHGHLDHIAGVDNVRAAYPAARIAMAKEEHAAFTDAEENLSAPFGMPVTLQSRPDDDLPPSMELQLGSLLWRVLDVSGHSRGGRAIYCPSAGVVFTGDSLFAGSIGRTDFPGADHDRLLANIRQHLYTLPPETLVHSGHGPTTRIEIERKSNPFVTDGD